MPQPLPMPVAPTGDMVAMLMVHQMQQQQQMQQMQQQHLQQHHMHQQLQRLERQVTVGYCVGMAMAWGNNNNHAIAMNA